jgi:2-iminobutanoate/2-iminopropanoate deaminase
MSKIETIHTDKAPKAIGPYSQARVYNGIIYCSGQIALTPAGEDLTDQSLEIQTRQALDNLVEVLKAANSSTENILKVQIFLIDMADFTEVNAIYNEYFHSQPPARATVAVHQLPKGARIEIDCIAVQAS